MHFKLESATPTRRQKYNKPQWVVRLEKMKPIETKVNQLKSVYKSIFQSIQDWTNNYLASLPIPSERHATEVAVELDHLYDLSEQCGDSVNPIIERIETANKLMPDSSKISNKRKRRRRKRK
jgi:hypothetical protein